MRGYQTHALATAYHEAGHALAALHVGRYVSEVTIDHRDPRNGGIWHRKPIRNPYRISSGHGTAQAAWTHTFDTTLDDMFINLAGPTAESKLLGSPLRQLGNTSDLENCMSLMQRLQILATFASHYTHIPAIDSIKLLNKTREKARRWIARPKIWKAIEVVALFLSEEKWVNGEQLHHLIGAAQESDQNRSLPTYSGELSRIISSKPKAPKRSTRPVRISRNTALSLMK